MDEFLKSNYVVVGIDIKYRCFSLQNKSYLLREFLDCVARCFGTVAEDGTQSGDLSLSWAHSMRHFIKSTYLKLFVRFNTQKVAGANSIQNVPECQITSPARCIEA